MATATRSTTTTAQTARPFDARLSAQLDLLELEHKQIPNRWRRRILQLRKLVAKHRAMGRAR